MRNDQGGNVLGGGETTRGGNGLGAKRTGTHSSSLIWHIRQCDSFKYFSPSMFKLFLCEPVC